MKTREPDFTRTYTTDGWCESMDGDRSMGERYVGLPRPRNTCGFCGAEHLTNPNGWRDARGLKVPCGGVNCVPWARGK